MPPQYQWLRGEREFAIIDLEKRCHSFEYLPSDEIYRNVQRDKRVVNRIRAAKDRATTCCISLIEAARRVDIRCGIGHTDFLNWILTHTSNRKWNGFHFACAAGIGYRLLDALEKGNFLCWVDSTSLDPCGVDISACLTATAPDVGTPLHVASWNASTFDCIYFVKHLQQRMLHDMRDAQHAFNVDGHNVCVTPADLSILRGFTSTTSVLLRYSCSAGSAVLGTRGQQMLHRLILSGDFPAAISYIQDFRNGAVIDSPLLHIIQRCFPLNSCSKSAGFRRCSSTCTDACAFKRKCAAFVAITGIPTTPS
jgi:hypothetical protein